MGSFADIDGKTVNPEDATVVRRTVTATYTMAFKSEAPKDILDQTDPIMATVEVMGTHPFDFVVTNVVSNEVLTGDALVKYEEDYAAITAQMDQYDALALAAESGDLDAVGELLFGSGDANPLAGLFN